MQTFVYKALKKEKLLSGEMEGKDQDEVASKLREKGLDILSIKGKLERVDIKKEVKKFTLFSKGKKVKKGDRVFLYKNFATMIKAGLPLPEIIDLLRESIKNPKLIEILGRLKYDIEAGKYISDSLSKYPDVFNTSEIAMIKAGEVGGSLSQSFLGLYQDAEAEYKLQKDIKGAMTYPVIILSILLMVVLLMLLYVLPQLTGFFNQANIEVPKMTRIIMKASDFFKKYFIYLFALFISLVVSLYIGIKKFKKMKDFFDNIMIKFPWVGKQFKYFYIYKIARMLGLLNKSGVPILQSLEIVEKSVTHTRYSNSIKKIRKDVKTGGKLSKSVDNFKDLYPPFVSRMLKVGDRTGNTSDALANVSDYYKEELQEALGNISTLIEPILMVFLGAGVAFMAIAVLIPLYSVVSGINQM